MDRHRHPKQSLIKQLRTGRTACLLCMMLFLVASSYPQRLGLVRHQSWSTDSGLPQASVHQILQTSDGYLWLATEGGVVRFDGVVFKALSHDSDPVFTSDDVSSLAEDGQGNVWFGTADGLIEDAHGSLRHFGEADGLPAATIGGLAVDGGGSLIALTGARVARFDGTHFKPVDNSPPNVERIQSASNGAVLLFTNGETYQLRDGRVIAAGKSADRVRGVAVGPRGVVWSWSNLGIVAQNSGRYVSWGTAQLPGSRIQTVVVDRSGLAWVGTNRGLAMLDVDSKQVVRVEALGANSILSLLQDAEGNFWIGTETTGLHALRARKFRDAPSLLDDEVSCVVQASDGAMWIGTRDDGLRRLPQGPGARAGRPVSNERLTSPVILSLAAGQSGDVWAGTPDGLNHIEADGKTTHYTSSNGLPDDLVRSLMVARDKTVWVGTRRGVSHFVAGHFLSPGTEQHLDDELIGPMIEASTSTGTGPGTRAMWISTLSGLHRLGIGGARKFTRADGLGSTLISGLTYDSRGRLWVTTRDAGLFFFDGQRFVTVRARGLPQELLGVVGDASGMLWLRARHGIVMAPVEGLATCGIRSECNLSLRVFGGEDGLPSDEMVATGQPNGWLTNKGELWFATRKGVAITDPAVLPINTVAPPVVIEHFFADGKQVHLQSDERLIENRYTRYTFNFAGLSYTIPSKVLYRSRLEPYDSDWSNPGTSRNASYTNLPAGTYTFRVQASNNDAVWSTPGASTSFQIVSPFYKKWWFIVGALALMGTFGFLLYRLRVRRMQQGFNAVLGERNRIAREIHDTLAQDFVGVSLQLDLASILLESNNVPDAAMQIKATRAFVRTGLEKARQSIWNLRSSTVQDSLPSRVKALEEQSTANGLRVEAKIEGAYRRLPAVVEEEIVKIVHEAVANGKRHAGATSLTIVLLYRTDGLTATIEDNGGGFSVLNGEAKAGRFGLRGMRERAASIGAELTITSSAENGTAVLLEVQDGKMKSRSRQ